jgi:hypothetical protein
VLTFLILGITIIWCHSFTKLTDAGGKCTTGSLSKFFTLLCTFVSTLLLILYPSQVTSNGQANDFINNLFNSSGWGSTGGDPCYSFRGGGSTTVILGTTKCRCLHVFTLDLYVYMVLWSCLWMLCCVWMWWILWSLNECVGYCDVWMNVLDLDVYMDVLYIVCANCVGFLISVVLVILFSAKKNYSPG